MTGMKGSLRDCVTPWDRGFEIFQRTKCLLPPLPRFLRFCDIHTDSVSATGGGDGMPWWVISDFQDRAGCFMEQCCCCCCFSGSCWSGCPECCRTSYLTNSQHPLQPCFCLPNCLLNCFGFGITTYKGDKEPWKAYSVGGEGNPSYMNVGNPSMRMNNSDEKWHTLYISAQAQNSAKRLYGSARNKADKESFFDPYVPWKEALEKRKEYSYWLQLDFFSSSWNLRL